MYHTRKNGYDKAHYHGFNTREEKKKYLFTKVMELITEHGHHIGAIPCVTWDWYFFFDHSPCPVEDQETLAEEVDKILQVFDYKLLSIYEQFPPSYTYEKLDCEDVKVLKPHITIPLKEYERASKALQRDGSSNDH